MPTSILFQAASASSVQMGHALDSFAYAYDLGMGWGPQQVESLNAAGIFSLPDLAAGCRDKTIRLDLQLFGTDTKRSDDGTSPPPHDHWDFDTMQRMYVFLPGPTGWRCFRLAQTAARKVKRGTADTTYVHRPEDGTKGPERWSIGGTGNAWILKVDCAGFIRNCLQHVVVAPHKLPSPKVVSVANSTTPKGPTSGVLMSLSDRDFMRAKDFFYFFRNIPNTVMDTSVVRAFEQHESVLHGWRQVTDLRMVIPGDIICYRPRGNAAGGAAFTSTDRDNISKLLKTVRTAQLWHRQIHHQTHAGSKLANSASTWSEAQGAPIQNDTTIAVKPVKDWTQVLVTRNMAKDMRVKRWVTVVKAKLQSIGIETVQDLYLNLMTPTTTGKNCINEKLEALGQKTLFPNTINLMKECCQSLAKNTGHIVFAAGPAVRMPASKKNPGTCYRIRVVHSTSQGITDPKTGEVLEGVQEHYRRFYLQENGTWTRALGRTSPLIPGMFDTALANETDSITTAKSTDDEEDDDGDADDDPMDDMDDDDDDNDGEQDDNNDGEDDESDGDDSKEGDDSHARALARGELIVEVIAGRMCF